MRIISIGGLVTSLVVGFLAITQISDLEDTLESLTTGPLQALVNNMTFFTLLLVGVVTFGLVVAAAWTMLND